MSDPASQGAPQLDTGELRHTLTIHDVERELVTAGVPRSRRQIIRYCETAMLDAVKVPGPTGPQWYVSPASLPKAIGDLKQWEAQRAGHTAPLQAVTSPVTVLGRSNLDSDTASHGEPQRATSDKKNMEENSATQPDTSRYVALLERDNEFLREQVSKKDEQISDLSKRFSETQTLLGAMQRMFAPLLGQADPFKSPPESREVTTPLS